MKIKALFLKPYSKYIWIALMLLAWELTAKLALVNPLAFPSLELIFTALIDSIINGDILLQSWDWCGVGFSDVISVSGESGVCQFYRHLRFHFSSLTGNCPVATDHSLDWYWQYGHFVYHRPFGFMADDSQYDCRL
jgi:hypothetical protein